MNGSELMKLVKTPEYEEEFAHLNWSGNFADYLNLVLERPEVARSAIQRIYDMVIGYGYSTYTEYKKEIRHYHFFSDPMENGRDAIFGLDVHMMKLVNVLKAGSMRYGPEKRVLLLHGPVGSSKSTIARLMKKGLERYTRTPEGALYTYTWTNLGDILDMEDELPCPVHSEPLLLIPEERRDAVLAEINRDRPRERQIHVEGSISPVCRFIFRGLMDHYKGDWEKVVNNHITIRRLVLSEKDRVGIGTFQPKDEKNQDSTELTGDINYRKIAQYGSDSDPRAFNFDGEFNIANRGVIEFIEVLKLDVAFLYDLLTASQEKKIKPKKFAQCDIDLLILGHTNEPEFRKLQSNEFMEALRDRTIKIDIPYITKLDEEIKIYEKDFNSKSVPHIHIAPHTLRMAAMWAVLTRLEEPKKANLTLMQKLKLYNGKTTQQFTEAKEHMFHYTDQPYSPWIVVRSDDKKRARLNAMRYLLSKLDYENKNARAIKPIDHNILGAAESIYEPDEILHRDLIKSSNRP